ncbi:LOW QUALITY PROTEIN: gap junction alpha-9 protein [Thomomys bottae]
MAEQTHMGDWNLLGNVLGEVHIHSTMTGKIWSTILFIFHMLVLGIAAEDVWSDEQFGFICNTEQPDCRNVCYDQAFPISLSRYWVMQVIQPSLVYMGHVLYRLRVLGKSRKRLKAQLRKELDEFEMPEDQRRLEQELCQLEGKRKPNTAPLREGLLCTYVIHIFTCSVVEAGLMTGYLPYGFHLEPPFKCHGYPCPNTVDCFISTTEKTIFLVFLQFRATVSLFLNILDISYLGLKKIKRGLGDWPSALIGRHDPQDPAEGASTPSPAPPPRANPAHAARAPTPPSAPRPPGAPPGH